MAKTWASLDISPTSLGPSLPWDSWQAGAKRPSTWALGESIQAVNVAAFRVGKEFSIGLGYPSDHIPRLSLNPNIGVSSRLPTRGCATRGGGLFGWNRGGELLGHSLQTRLYSTATEIVCRYRCA